MKRKESPIPLSRCNPAAPRPLAPQRSTRAYPSAGELAGSADWRAWLESTLAAVLRPAVVAGTLGLAACSMARGADPVRSSSEIAPEAPPVALNAPTPPAPPPGASWPTAPVTLQPTLPTVGDLTLAGGPRAVQPPALPIVSPRATPRPPRPRRPRVQPPEPRVVVPVVVPVSEPTSMAGGARPVQLPLGES